jgi:ribosome-binding protein aMBF1 (putative translation factor)
LLPILREVNTMNTKVQTRLRDAHKRQASAIRKLPIYGQIKSEFDLEYTIAKQLTEARRSAGLTQNEVALAMGTTQSVISRIERGTNVSIETLERYVSVCGRHLRVQVV